MACILPNILPFPLKHYWSPTTRLRYSCKNLQNIKFSDNFRPSRIENNFTIFCNWHFQTPAHTAELLNNLVISIILQTDPIWENSPLLKLTFYKWELPGLSVFSLKHRTFRRSWRAFSFLFNKHVKMLI